MSREMHFPQDWSSFGPKMLALRERERRYVWAFLTNAMLDGRENGAQAARDAGYSDLSEGAKVRACLLMQREDVLEALQEVAGRELRGLAVPAMAALSRLIAKPDHADHRKAIEMVLNRTGHGERTTVDVNVSGEVTVNHTDRALEDLRRLKELGASRSKLEEIFGHSGLPRYERMLAEQAKVSRESPKLIEHEPIE